MGILPLQFIEGQERRDAGSRRLRDHHGGAHRLLGGAAEPGCREGDGREAPTAGVVTFDAIVRIDTPTEGRYYENGGILQYVLRDLIKG